MMKFFFFYFTKRKSGRILIKLLRVVIFQDQTCQNLCILNIHVFWTFVTSMCKLLSEERERKMWYFKKKILELRYFLEGVHWAAKDKWRKHGYQVVLVPHSLAAWWSGVQDAAESRGTWGASVQQGLSWTECSVVRSQFLSGLYGWWMNKIWFVAEFYGHRRSISFPCLI